MQDNLWTFEYIIISNYHIFQNYTSTALHPILGSHSNHLSQRRKERLHQKPINRTAAQQQYTQTKKEKDPRQTVRSSSMAQARCNRSNQSTIQLGSDPASFVSENRGLFTPHVDRERVVRAKRPVTDTGSNLGFRAAEGSSPQVPKPRSESTGPHRAQTQSVYIGGEHTGKVRAFYGLHRPEPARSDVVTSCK